MSIPDKLKYKTTITNTLRDQISELIKNRPEPCSYLEIGCDIGYTIQYIIATVGNNIKSITALDIDKIRIENLKKRIVDDRVNCIIGKSDDLSIGWYDVILIDADHSYEAVSKDWTNLVAKNTSNKFTVIFHDYGLKNVGVKKFINEKFKDFKLIGMKEKWNPMGGEIDDYEAAIISFERSPKE